MIIIDCRAIFFFNYYWNPIINAYRYLGSGGGKSSSSSSPPRHDDDYIHELEFKRRRQPNENNNNNDNNKSFWLPMFGPRTSAKSNNSGRKGWLDKTSDLFATPTRDDTYEEYQGLLALSEIEEEFDDDDSSGDDDDDTLAPSSSSPPRPTVDIQLPCSPLFDISPLRIPTTTTTTTTPANKNTNTNTSDTGAITLGSSKYHGDDEKGDDYFSC
jgi:hypothetical protein